MKVKELNSMKEEVIKAFEPYISDLEKVNFIGYPYEDKQPDPVVLEGHTFSNGYDKREGFPVNPAKMNFNEALENSIKSLIGFREKYKDVKVFWRTGPNLEFYEGRPYISFRIISEPLNKKEEE